MTVIILTRINSVPASAMVKVLGASNKSPTDKHTCCLDKDKYPRGKRREESERIHLAQQTHRSTDC